MEKVLRAIPEVFDSKQNSSFSKCFKMFPFNFLKWPNGIRLIHTVNLKQVIPTCVQPFYFHLLLVNIAFAVFEAVVEELNNTPPICTYFGDFFLMAFFFKKKKIPLFILAKAGLFKVGARPFSQNGFPEEGALTHRYSQPSDDSLNAFG